jgi:hypothetical protein
MPYNNVKNVSLLGSGCIFADCLKSFFICLSTLIVFGVILYMAYSKCEINYSNDLPCLFLVSVLATAPLRLFSVSLPMVFV